MTKQTIFIDYDGVILDSLNEKLFTGFNAYFVLNKNTKLFNSEKLTFDNYHAEINENINLVSSFRSLVPFIGLAGENACAFKIIENSQYLPSNKEEFRIAINKFCKELYYEYDYLVKSLREKYSKYSSRKFLKLCPSHKKIVNTIKKYSNQINWEIITNKPIENVLFFNKQFKIDKIIKDIHYCDANINKKSDIILNLIKEKTLNRGEIAFIDDLFLNLKDLHKKGYKCILADWGFEINEVKDRASKIGINVITKSGFENFLISNE
jgi:hypothetical protein